MSLKYVVIDDSGFVRELIRSVCDTHGMKFMGEGESASEGFKVVESTKPDIAVVDLVLPRTNGLDLIKAIRERFPKVKIIACSTLTDEYVQNKAFEAGCDFFLKKPFTRQSIGEAIRGVSTKLHKDEVEEENIESSFEKTSGKPSEKASEKTRRVG